MITLSSLVQFLDTYLAVDTYKHSDGSLNGLQVDSGKTTVRKIGYAVDSGLSVIQKAIDNEVDLLIVHHGLFWKGTTENISGPFGEKIRLCMQKGCSIYAAHLPLDGHSEVGNAACIAKMFGLQQVKPYSENSEPPIGVHGVCAQPQSIDTFAKSLKSLAGAGEPLVLPFGKEKISKVVILTGSAAFLLPLAAKEGFELLISGEPKQAVYHQARELGMNAIFGGHYATETVGVAAAAKLLCEKYDLKGVFIDEPTGI